MAIETLYTATAVIKQSRVSYDKRCRMLVESLNDCLNSIETKCFPSRCVRVSEWVPSGHLPTRTINPLLLSTSVAKDTVLGSVRGADRGSDIESAHPARSGSEGVTESTEIDTDRWAAFPHLPPTAPTPRLLSHVHTGTRQGFSVLIGRQVSIRFP